MRPRDKQWGLYRDLGIMRGIKWKLKTLKKILNGDTRHVTQNPMALTNMVIKVVPSYFYGDITLINGNCEHI